MADICPYNLMVLYKWDPRKAKANYYLHQVTFSEAALVLEDANALTREDIRAVGEQRFVTLGMSDQARLLVVVYTWREPDIVRIISAWKGSRKQRKLYE